MRANSFKMYQKAGETRLYRVHPNGKVETSSNGQSWYHITSLNPSIINKWRRLGIVEKVGNRVKEEGHRDTLSAALTRARDALMYGEWESLSQLIPVTMDGLFAYERRDMQTIKVCPSIARGYDEWSARDAMEIINRGLSIPCLKMERRRQVLNRLIDDLERRIALV